MNTTSARYKFSVAPMVDVTDSSFRYLCRLLSPHSLLYSEMIPILALTRGKKELKEKFLFFVPEERPLAFQLAGNSIPDYVEACQMLEDLGAEEINLNLGCPAKSARKSAYGLVQLKLWDENRAFLEAARRATKTARFSIKTRIGVDELAGEEFLTERIGSMVDLGCDKVILHARHGYTKGVTPKKNRSLPPLDYEQVFQIKRAFPELELVINGGLDQLDTCQQMLTKVDGVMLGRKIQKNLLFLLDVEQHIFQSPDYKQQQLQRLEAILAQFFDHVQAHAKVLPKNPYKALCAFTHNLEDAKKIRTGLLKAWSSKEIVRWIQALTLQAMAANK